MEKTTFSSPWTKYFWGVLAAVGILLAATFWVPLPANSQELVCTTPAVVLEQLKSEGFNVPPRVLTEDELVTLKENLTARQPGDYAFTRVELFSMNEVPDMYFVVLYGLNEEQEACVLTAFSVTKAEVEGLLIKVAE